MSHQPLLLAKDSLTAFLTELDDLGELSSLPSSSHVCRSDVGDSSGGLPRSKRPKTRSSNENKPAAARNTKAEHDGRVDALNQEIRVLYQELQRLHIMDPESLPCGKSKWRRRAATERFSRTRAEYTNESLRQRVAEGVTFQEQVRQLLLSQLDLHSRRTSRVEFALIDDDARAFGVLKNDLLKQQMEIESSLHSRLSDITRRSLLPRHDQAKSNWSIAVTRQVMHMRVEEVNVLPFNADMMNAAMCKFTQDGSVPVDGDRVVEKVIRDMHSYHGIRRGSLERVTGGRELECRHLSRRIRNEYGTIIVWESMAYWQRSDAVDDRPRAVVHESGWTTTVASEQDPEHLSIMYCSKAFRIESLNGPRMKKNDPLLRKIVHTHRELHNLHDSCVESFVIDASRGIS